MTDQPTNHECPKCDGKGTVLIWEDVFDLTIPSNVRCPICEGLPNRLAEFTTDALMGEIERRGAMEKLGNMVS